MAVFTALSRTEVSAFLSQFSLGELVDLQGIHTGIENTNYFVTTDHGSYVLTLFERLTEHATAVLPAVDAAPCAPGTACARAATDAGRGACCGTEDQTRRRGDRLPGKATTAPTAAQCANVGEFLARMHLAGQDFAPFQPHLRGIGWWKSAVPKLEPHVPDEVMNTLVEELILPGFVFSKRHFEKLPTGPIHADLFRDNVLLVTMANGDRIGGVIDFYFAGCSIWLFDLAITDERLVHH